MRTLLSLLVLLAACDPNDVDRHDPDPKETGNSDTSDPDDTALPTVEGCRAEPAAADRDRVVVVGLPYDSRGRQSTAWANLSLSAAGDLTDSGQRFDMGRGFDGQVAFTPDGQIGLIAQEDGSLGVFRVEDDGSVTVVHAAFSGDFYAEKAVVEPSGETAWIVDYNFPENGGGLYRVPISCDDGSLGTPEFVLAGKLPADLLLTRHRLDRALLVGREVGGADAGEDAFLLDWGADPVPLAGVDAFGHDEASVTDGALTYDDRYALIADNSEWSGQGNKVAVVALDDNTLTAVQILSLNDPVALLTSPWNNAALAVSGYGNAVFLLEYNPSAAEPFTDCSEPPYQGADPQLPAGAAMITRGSLQGLVLVAENQGVRRMRFNADGTLEDLGVAVSGDGYDWITGSIGVQP